MDLKERIKAAKDIRSELIVIEEWDNAEIEIRTMGARQRANMFNTCLDKKGDIIHDKFQVAVIIACCFDPKTNTPLFDAADDKWLMDKSAGAIEKIANATMKISGLTTNESVAAEKK